jgi:3-oxoadipate enol-lactonase
MRMTERRPIRTGFVETNGAKLYYEMMGKGSALTLLHAGYLDCQMWDEQFAPFAQESQVLRYDIRGHGRSTFPEVPFADEQDLYTLLTTVGVQKTALLGLSLGGWIAVDFTLQHPEMVEALVLVGAPVSGLPPELTPQKQDLSPQEQQKTARWNQALQERNLPVLVEVVMQNATLVPSPDFPAARQRVHELLSRCSFAYFFKPELRQILNPPAYQRLADLQVPTLLLVGDQDHLLLRRTAQVLEEKIDGARRVLLPHSHHLANMEQPELFNQMVLQFLKQVRSKRPGAQAESS